jgi:hypothetical protein
LIGRGAGYLPDIHDTFEHARAVQLQLLLVIVPGDRLVRFFKSSNTTPDTPVSTGSFGHLLLTETPIARLALLAGTR